MRVTRASINVFLISILGLVILIPKQVNGQCEVSALKHAGALCCSASITAHSTGTPPFSYQWSTGNTTLTIDSLCAGTYYVTVTDSFGCVAIDSFFYPADTGEFAVSAVDAPCSGCTGDLDIKYTYSGAFSVSIDPPPPPGPPWPNAVYPKPGVYVVTITSVTGCVFSDTVQIGVKDTAYVRVMGNANWCCEGEVEAFPLNGKPPFSYQWSSGDTTRVVDSICGGLYSVTMTDSLGRTAVDSIPFPPADTGSIRIYAIDAPCSTCNGNIDMNYSGGVCLPFVIQTDPPNHFGIGYPPGTYIVTITDACGCQEIDTVTVGIDTTLGTGPEPQQPSFRQIGNTLIFDHPVEEVRIYDLQGRLVRFAEGVRRMDLDGLVSGAYILQSIGGNGTLVSGKIIIPRAQ